LTTEYSIRKLQKTTSNAQFKNYKLIEFNDMINIKCIVTVLIYASIFCITSFADNGALYNKTKGDPTKEIPVADTLAIEMIEQMIIGAWTEDVEQDDELTRTWVFTEQGTLRQYEGNQLYREVGYEITTQCDDSFMGIQEAYPDDDKLGAMAIIRIEKSSGIIDCTRAIVNIQRDLEGVSDSPLLVVGTAHQNIFFREYTPEQ